MGCRPIEETTEELCHLALSRHSNRIIKENSHVFCYQEDDPIDRQTLNDHSLYGYLVQNALIEDTPVSTFIDNGASFNAISDFMAQKLSLSVKAYDKPLRLTVGGNQSLELARRVTSFTLKMPGFSPYKAQAFVMDIPENRDVLLGMPWLEAVNPDINWQERTINSRDSPLSHAFTQCERTQSGITQIETQHGLHIHSLSGLTKVVPATEMESFIAENDNEFFFVLSPKLSSEDDLWVKLKDSPEYPIISKYRGTVFVDELPSIPPQRFPGLEASIELTDDVPVARKQFVLSPEQQEAIRKWTKEMVTAGIIRKSTSPYSSPTFCVKKASGEWRIVHDFRGINAKMRVPANPIPQKAAIHRNMAGSYWFSCMDLLWGFFQTRLEEKLHAAMY